MGRWLQRIRGGLGMGLTWAFVWSAAGLVPRWVFGFHTDAPFPLVFGVLGFLAGVAFSAVLVAGAGGRRLQQMSLPRFAGWGAAAGLLLAAVFTRMASLGAVDVLAIMPTFAAACALCASGSLVLARRAETRALPDVVATSSGDDADPERAELH